MKRPSPWLSLFALVLLIPLFGPGGAHAVRAGAASQDTPANTVYLPLVTGNTVTAHQGSVALIDRAVAPGALDAETGMIYKVFATFSDPRLPPEYVGSGVGPEADGIMRDVVVQAEAGTLSPGAIQTLAPFFVPPDHPGSWYEQQRILRADEAGLHATAATTWAHLDAVGGKARILWPTDLENGPAVAAGLKAELESAIWPKLTTLMGTEPQPDDTGKVRIFLWGSYVETNGTVVPFDAATLGVTVPGSGSPLPGIIYLKDDAPLGSATTPGLIDTLTHEFMHTLQFAMGCKHWPNYAWLMESLATWSQDYVHKDINDEWQYAPVYLKHTYYQLDTVDFPDLMQYGTYLLPYYLTHRGRDLRRIRWCGISGERRYHRQQFRGDP